MTSQTCTKCGREVTIVYRTAPLGEAPALWRCWECLSPEEKEMRLETRKFVEEVFGK